jgi:hypothetical protein
MTNTTIVSARVKPGFDKRVLGAACGGKRMVVVGGEH